LWNRIPDDVRREIVDLALEEPELSPLELSVTFTDTKGCFVSEASVYRPKADDQPSFFGRSEMDQILAGGSGIANLVDAADQRLAVVRPEPSMNS
jgi:hypothetical protein